jgi:hypothetical protein
MADRLQWRLTYNGREYIFDPKEMLTVTALRQIKQWFGPELGRYMTFQGALLQQDPEAALCALWLARKAAGEQNVPEPNQMDDFSIGELFEKGYDTPSETKEPDPTPARTPGSTETPTNSDPDGSEPSPTSAT